MAIIETTSTLNLSLLGREYLSVQEAQVGDTYHGNIEKYKETEIVNPDIIRVSFPAQGKNFLLGGEDINWAQPFLPAAQNVRWGLRPTPGLLQSRTQLLWTPEPETVTDPEALRDVDGILLHTPSSTEEELIYDLGNLARAPKIEEKHFSDWFERLASGLDSRIPQGAVVNAYVDLVALAGVGFAIKNGNRQPLIAAMQGLLGATLANSVGSVVNHRMGTHGSVEFTPKTTTALRVANALIAGAKPDRFRVLHNIHHKYADTPDDIHSQSYLGRWNITFHHLKIIADAAKQNASLIAAEQNDPVVRSLPIDNVLVTTLGIAGTHWLMGEILRQPIEYRAYSAVIQLAGTLAFGSTFMGDSHPGGAPRDFDFNPIVSAVMGGEDEHGRHHAEPWDPRHAKVDPGYLLISILKKLGLATIPAEKMIKERR